MTYQALVRGNAQGFLVSMLFLCGCTMDFERFRCKDPNGCGEGGDPTSATSTTSTDATTTGSSMGGMGGGGGNPTTTSTGGSGGTGGTTTSSSGGGGAGGGCNVGETDCSGTCVSDSDPDYGCGSCTPCALDHATASCSGGTCIVAQCDQDFDDCDGMDDTGCEASLLLDADSCGGCMSPCGSVTNGMCNNGTCQGPCGDVPQAGLFVCWAYGGTMSPSEYVGLAGGEANPALGQSIDEVFLDPMGGCTSAVAGEPFVQCSLGMPASNWDIQFRAGLHAAPGVGTTAGTWDCSTGSCAGSVFVYQDGTEVGSLVSDVASGVITTVPHFNPPNLLNVKVTVP